MFQDTMKQNNSDSIPYQSQHVEHWQLITSGVAHDFNNLLTSILGQSTLALRQLPAEETARHHIEKVIQAAEYAASLTDQLLTYSKGSQGYIESINLNQLIQDNLSLLDTSFLDDISLLLKLAPTLPLIQAKRGQLQQVVMNLLINAAEAIQPLEGTITIRTGTQIFVEQGKSIKALKGRSLRPGNYVYLQVQDDGIGMDSATQEQVFRPFFTTKSTGRGLGLSAIHEIIRSQRGSITVESQVKKGTTFTVYLPYGNVIHPPQLPLQ